MNSLLITGGSQETRQQKALEIAAVHSSQFDIKIFDTAESRGIDLSRSVVKEAALKPYDSPVTTIIIYEASRLTKEAQNALLKILEEPDATLQLILTTPSRDSLLATVASRLAETNLSGTSPKNPDLNWDELYTKSLSEKLSLLENTKRDDYILFWQNQLSSLIANNDNKIKSVHRYNKLLLKMTKAEKSLVNKKLIDLILALEIPKK